MTDVDVQLRNDYFAKEKVPELTTERVTDDLAGLFSYATQWWTKPGPTLTFESMLAAMTASDKPLCRWLQRHLGLRGVSNAAMTGGKVFERQDLPVPLQTSESFRTALEVARELCGVAGAALDVRHFMAAYAVCPEYHLAEFLRLRIDRRAWCLELAERLTTLYPAEAAAWQAYAGLAPAIPTLAFSTDAPVGRDLLNLDREVEAFARLIAAKTTVTPLSIGVFGAWGSGKSFFMERVRERVARLQPVGEEAGRASAYHGRIAQIEFNAWHYSEGSLIACLVDHIFRNLRIGGEDEDEATLRRRSAELIVQIDGATQALAGKEHDVDDAAGRQAAAQQALAAIEAKIPAEVAAKQRELEAANAALRAAKDEVAKATAQQQAEIEAAQAKAPARAALALFRKDIADPKVDGAVKDFTDLIDSAKSIGTRWVPIALGLAAIAIGWLATQFLASKLYAHVASVVASFGTFAVVAKAWLGKLDAIAKRGEEFQQTQAKLAEAAKAAVIAAHKPALDALAATQQTREAALATRQQELDAIAKASGVARDELAALQQQRTVAVDVRDRAAAELAARKGALAQLGSGSLLGEFLDDRASTDGYRKGLTIFSQVRNDFDRLSRLIARATDEYLRAGKPAPPVTRIVLYIDDLDRCPEERVVEVLRVVHLLLAFPLFVCVAAVDPRWVTQCLRAAPGLVDREHVGADGKALGEPATSADYLEKIFQIPLWLRPVPAAQRASIVRALLDPEGDRADVHLEAPVVSLVAPADALMAKVANHTPVGMEGVQATTDRPPTDLTIDAVELDYLDQLAGLLGGNPRALKRFVNTYRLVKSALSDVELQVFRSHVRVLGSGTVDARYLPYRMCMVQLAVLCTQRERALQMVQLADDPGDANARLGDWLAKLTAVDKDLAKGVAMAVTGDLGNVSLDTFRLWLERTRRYSFYV